MSAPAVVEAEPTRADLLTALEGLEAQLVRLSATLAADIERNTADA